MTGKSFDAYVKLDLLNEEFQAMDRRIIQSRIADLDAQIAETRRDIAKYPHELDIEIIRLAEIERANWLAVLKNMDRRRCHSAR